MPTAATLATCILAVVVLVSAVQLEAQVIPGRWEKLDATALGTEIIVLLQTDMKIQGKLQRSTPEAITVLTDTATIQVAKVDVREITTAQIYSDSLLNGGLIGAGIGLGVALSVLAVAASGEGYVLRSAKWAGPLFGFGTGLGAGIALDAGRKRRQILYRAR